MTVKIGVISLGCAKNRVDTEIMLGILQEQNYEFVQDVKQADIMLINTCSFITDAKEESIEAVLEAEQQKRFGNLKGIIVTGCLPERYREELFSLLPRVDAFLGVCAFSDIKETVEQVLSGKKHHSFCEKTFPESFTNRVVTTKKPTAYVKISEGCNNNCSYCIIPTIRGGHRSRPIESILEEITWLASEGYSEIILIAQDTTKYGEDIYGKPQISELLEDAAQIEGVKWLRVLYSYPEGITEEMLQVMDKYDTIVKYVDMPVQHMDDDILAGMNRRNTYETIKDKLALIRDISLDFVVRSTVIVGFPGENSKTMENLRKRISRAKFDRLGVFAYSQEEGTKAAEFENQAEEEDKMFWQDNILAMQALISHKKNNERVGNVCEVLIEGKDENRGYYYGRSYCEAPDVDGKILIKSKEELLEGHYYNVKIIQAHYYDCIGEVV